MIAALQAAWARLWPRSSSMSAGREGPPRVERPSGGVDGVRAEVADLVAAVADLRAEVAAAVAVVPGELAAEQRALRDELARLVKAQARAALSSEAESSTSKAALEEVRGACRARERDADDLRGALTAMSSASRRESALAWLPVLDGIESCLAHARLLVEEARGSGAGIGGVLRRLVSPGVGAEALEDGLCGLELLHARALGVLASSGAAPMAGDVFDPALHVAVGVRTNGPAGRVAEEVLRGYTIDGKPLRLAEVIVYTSEEESGS
jgi:hypothetical protein